MNAQVKRWTTGLATLVIVLTVTLMTLGAAPWNSSASPLAPNAEELEPNGTFAQANPIAVGELMFGDIETISDLDYFVLSATVGSSYRITLTPRESQIRQLDIYNAAFARISGGSTSTTAPVSFDFTATGTTTTTTYYLRVSIGAGQPTTAGDPSGSPPYDYQLQADSIFTPPPNTATFTVTPTPPLLPPPGVPVEAEPNDVYGPAGNANPLSVPGKVVGAITNIFDVDCFAINTLGLQYRLILTDYGLTRWLKVYDNSGYYIMGNTTSSNHQVELTLQANTTPYYLCVSPVSTASVAGTVVDYLLEVSILQPTPTPTNTNTPAVAAPTSTARATFPSGSDSYEPNYSFELATTIAPGLNYNLNFMPWGGAAVDNDYFKIRVKPGLQLTCETSNLDPGVDPRMAFYTGPAEGYFLMANDDIALGNFNSRLSYYASYEGFLYILIGQGDRMDIRDAAQSAYSIKCELGVPGASATPGAGVTPAPGKGDYTPPVTTPSPTKTPQTPVSPVATPTLPPEEAIENRELDFRLVTTPPPPTRTPAPTGYRTFRVIVYYDANNDGMAGAGEGVPGFYVTVHSPETKVELARGYTDDQGQISFTVSTVGTVRVMIPLLGFDRLIEATKPEVSVRIAPPTLPVSIP